MCDSIGAQVRDAAEAHYQAIVRQAQGRFILSAGRECAVSFHLSLLITYDFDTLSILFSRMAIADSAMSAM